MNANADLYATLGVSREASQEDIKRAFRKLAMEYHPDRNKADGAEDKFKEISAAYDVLSDQEKRSAYDRFGVNGLNGGGQHGFSGFEGFGGFGDIFDAFFRGTATRRAGPQRGADRRSSVRISFEQAVFGGEHDVEFERIARCEDCRGSGAAPGTSPTTCPECNGQGEIHRVQESLFGRFVNAAVCGRCGGDGEVVAEPCTTCRGRGLRREQVSRVVNIPAGVDEEHQIRLSGEGDAGQRGGPAGNVYLDIEVEPHEHFTRQRDHLVYDLPLNPAQAALGADVEVPTLDGEPVAINVPPGTQPGHVFSVKGRGAPHLRAAGRGDLLVRTHVVTPTKLDDEQRELLERLAESLGTPALPADDRGFFDRLREAFS
jgi:molecular chaperone DnaJ